MPGFNLVRNAKVLFTNNLGADKSVTLTGATAGNTQELQVMNGFSFSQNTENQTITVAEAGLDPARGQRAFNTALAPVDFSFTTYIRPRNNSGITCEEKVLWNALFSDVAIDSTGTSLTASAIARTTTFNQTQFTFTAANLSTYKIGEVITIKGVTDTNNPKDWNAPAVIVSSSSNAGATSGSALGASDTTLTVKYLIAPSGTGNPSTTTGTIVIFKGAVTQQVAGTNHLLAHSGRSNKNQLVAFGLVVVFDDQTYVIDNCSLNQASIDFGLDGIAQVAWTGQGTVLRQVAATTLNAGTATGGFAGSYTVADTAAQFITNKLTTTTLSSTFRGAGTGATAYTLAITGGNLTINNNITYVTPEIMGTVNKPIGYFTGTRAISGNLTAYLKTGSNATGGLLTALLAAGSENKYALGLQIGGSTNATRVDIDLPAVTLQIPTVETQDVVSTTINFSAQTFNGASSAAADLASASYDLEATNDITIRYYSA